MKVRSTDKFLNAKTCQNTDFDVAELSLNIYLFFSTKIASSVSLNSCSLLFALYSCSCSVQISTFFED